MYINNFIINNILLVFIFEENTFNAYLVFERDGNRV